MGSQGFDQRYPSMFQPGGEGEAGELFVPSPPLSGALAPPAQGAADAQSAGRTPASDPAELDGSQPGAREYADTGHEQHREVPLPLLEKRWSPRTWMLCLSAVLVALAGSAFCLVAIWVIPGAATVDPSANQGIMVAPWGTLILPGASALLTAALGMLAALCFAAAQHYRARAWWYYGAAAAVGLSAVAGGFVGMFGELLFAATVYSRQSYNENPYVPWFIVFQSAAWQLLLLGLATLALVVVILPRRNRIAGTPSAAAAFWTGLAMIGAGLWVWFATQLYPLAEGRVITVDDQSSYVMQPWTALISPAGAPLVMVGSAALFWWVFIVATTRRTPVEPPFDEESGLEATP